MTVPGTDRTQEIEQRVNAMRRTLNGNEGKGVLAMGEILSENPAGWTDDFITLDELEGLLERVRSLEVAAQRAEDCLDPTKGVIAAANARGILRAVLDVASPANGVNYTGPQPGVECAYQPCTNRLLEKKGWGPQFCSEEHRSLGVAGREIGSPAAQVPSEETNQ